MRNIWFSTSTFKTIRLSFSQQLVVSFGINWLPQMSSVIVIKSFNELGHVVSNALFRVIALVIELRF